MEQRNINFVLPLLKPSANEEKKEEKKRTSRCRGRNLSFTLQKIPTQTFVSREQYTSSLSTDAPGQCHVSPVNSIHNTQPFFISEFKVTKLLVKSGILVTTGADI
jgi:hypothetical protein